ncbi:MAG TPA: hypothetical protein VLV50_10275 [Stellaceae bacterium]|nr:hypothetical protein [Stellaceae bacterium]
MRIDSGREIIIPPGFAERPGVPQTWRIAAVEKRDARRPLPRELAPVPPRRLRGRLVDIVV